MNVSKHNISTSVLVSICTSVEDIWPAMEGDPELGWYIINVWPSTRELLEPRVENYWPIRHELVMIYDTAMNDKCIIIPFLLQKQILEQLHNNHVGIEKHLFS